jgi:hypothetical protein
VKQLEGNFSKTKNNNKSTQLSDSQHKILLGIFGVGITELEIKYKRGHSTICPKNKRKS